MSDQLMRYEASTRNYEATDYAGARFSRLKEIIQARDMDGEQSNLRSGLVVSRLSQSARSASIGSSLEAERAHPPTPFSSYLHWIGSRLMSAGACPSEPESVAISMKVKTEPWMRVICVLAIIYC